MKLKKIVLILAIPFFLTGCVSAKYTLDIDKDLKISEEVFISATSEYFGSFYKNNPITIVKEWYNDDEMLNSLIKNNYSHELVTENVTYPGVLVKKKYDTLSEYANNTIFKDQIFENVYSITNDNLITLKATGFLPYVDDQTDVRFPISNLKINIKVPYVVTDHNADKFNPKNNTYTWEITKETEEKEINLTFDKTKIYVYNLVMYISIFILSLIVIILIFLGYKLIKKSKINNKIIE